MSLWAVSWRCQWTKSPLSIGQPLSCPRKEVLGFLAPDSVAQENPAWVAVPLLTARNLKALARRGEESQRGHLVGLIGDAHGHLVARIRLQRAPPHGVCFSHTHRP